MSTAMRRCVRVVLGAMAIVAIVTPATASAQITRVSSSSDLRQAIGFNLGYFSIKDLDSRGTDDVLFLNLDSLLFDIDEFNGATYGAEWLFAVTDYIEVGAGIGFYQQTVPSIYRFLVGSDETEIAQELKLRQIPMSATVRFLPIGRRAAVQPYIGAGIGAINWRYTETGEFVDFDNNVFRDSFKADGTEIGPVVLGGVRFPIADVWLLGGEIRWHSAEGETGGIDAGFLGNKIDLGGWSANFTAHFRF